MLDLPSVTLLCIDCENVDRAFRVMDHCRSLCDFGAVRFLTSEPTDRPHDKIGKIGSGDRVQGLVQYSEFVLKNVYKFVDTTHMLIVQHDGWVLHPESWRDQWLHFDYMGPLFVQHPFNGSGGFSLRSRKMMEQVAGMLPTFNMGTGYNGTGYIHEDGVIAFGLKASLERKGFQFAPTEVAAQFAYGGNKTHYCPTPFGFHGFYALDTLMGGSGWPIERVP